jgi:ECF transporter S component (folate family)
MLIALAFVLERLLPIINAPTMRITIAFIPMMFCGMLFGPIWGAIAFGISDILGWPIMGLAPIPLILASRILSGFLFGLFLHRENVKLWPHTILSVLMVQTICGMWLTTLGLSQLPGTPSYEVLLWTRLPQFGILTALQIAVFPVLLKLRDALKKAGHVITISNSSYESE